MVLMCGKGTYVRSVARDLGDLLGVGAYLHALRRTRIGVFHVEDAVAWDAQRVTLLPMAQGLAELPRCPIRLVEETRLRQGQAVTCNPGPAEEEVALVNATGDVVGVATRDATGRLLRPTRMLG
jgi:tRNA pseudouridine55 synthase